MLNYFSSYTEFREVIIGFVRAYEGYSVFMGVG